MDQLFEKIVVDGSLSTTPTHGGQGSGGAPIQVADNVGDGSGTDKDSLRTPRSCTSLGKRTSSSQDTATSPSRGRITKKATSGVAGLMQSFLDRLEIVQEEGKTSMVNVADNLIEYANMRTEKLQKEKKDKFAEATECLRMVESLGIQRNTRPWYDAQRVFGHTYNRTNFKMCETPEEMMGWLRGYGILI